MHSDDYNAYCAEIDLCTDVLRIEYLLEHARMLQEKEMCIYELHDKTREYDDGPTLLINRAARRRDALRLSAALGNPEGWTFGGDPDG